MAVVDPQSRPVEVALALPPSADAGPLARALVRRHSVGWRAPALDAVLLLVTEVVTNAVRHAPAPAHLVLRDDGVTVRVGVHDAGGAPLSSGASAPSWPGPGATGGRGMALLAALADLWGSEVLAPAAWAGGAGPPTAAYPEVHHVVWFVVDHTSSPADRAQERLHHR